jgi:hypothetical protein
VVTLPVQDKRVRWVASRKEAVVVAVAAGEVTAEHVCASYGIDSEELASWQQRFALFGRQGLEQEMIQELRP